MDKKEIIHLTNFVINDSGSSANTWKIYESIIESKKEGALFSPKDIIKLDENQDTIVPPLYKAIEACIDPELIKLLKSFGYDINYKVKQWEKIYNFTIRKCVYVNRYYSIPNCILRAYYSLTNNYCLIKELEKRWNECQKGNPDFQHFQRRANRKDIYEELCRKRYALETEKDYTKDELFAIEREKRYQAKKHETELNYIKEYCNIFNIDLNELIQKGEELPEDCIVYYDFTEASSYFSDSDTPSLLGNSEDEIEFEDYYETKHESKDE